jgi:Flp pilus assembly protein TadG
LRIAAARIPASRLRRDEEGSALIEFSASATVLLMTVVGLMNISMAIYSYHYVSEAAREGSRYAMVRGNTYTTPATAASIQTYVQGLAYPGITSSNMTVATTWAVYPSGGTCSPSATCNNPGNMVTVKATYTYPLAIPVIGKKTLTMTSTSTMIIAQ